MILISGKSWLAVALEQELVRVGAPVERLSDGCDLSPGGLGRLATAAVLVLADADDAENGDTALSVRRLRPELPLVVRLFDAALVAYLKRTLDRITLLSVSAIAAPAFAEAALHAIAQPRGEPGPEELPLASVGRGVSWQKPDRVLVSALLGFVTLVATATAYFAVELKLAPLDALYFVWTTVMTVGYGDITLTDASPAAKVIGMALMLAGAAFMAVLFAFFTGWVVTRRFEVLHGRVRARGHGQVVIAGSGNVGALVAGLMHAQGHRIVLIEKDAESRHLSALRAAGHHVIVADATSSDILDLAGVQRASAVLVLTDSDASNLHVALLVRACCPQVPVVMRVLSPELSAHVSERRDAVAISPVSVAVREFARAALAALGLPAD